ncbi:MAG TPA: glutathione S-transferase family protein [Nevskiaceae bacterium]
MELYGHRLSQPSRAVEILLRELSIPYAWREVDFTGGGTRTAQYLGEVTPLGTVPALIVTELGPGAPSIVARFAESHAIMRYLCRRSARTQAADDWYPGDHDPLRAALIDQWLDWHHNNIRRYDMFHHLVNLHRTLPLLKREIHEIELLPRQHMLRRALAVLDRHLGAAGNTPTLTGDDRCSIADLAISCELYQIAAVGYRFETFRSVRRWLDAMSARPVFRAVSADITALGKTIGEQEGKYLALESALM